MYESCKKLKCKAEAELKIALEEKASALAELKFQSADCSQLQLKIANLEATATATSQRLATLASELDKLREERRVLGDDVERLRLDRDEWQSKYTELNERQIPRACNRIIASFEQTTFAFRHAATQMVRTTAARDDAAHHHHHFHYHHHQHQHQPQHQPQHHQADPTSREAINRRLERIVQRINNMNIHNYADPLDDEDDDEDDDDAHHRRNRVDQVCWCSVCRLSFNLNDHNNNGRFH